MRRRDRIAAEVADHLDGEFPDHFYGAVYNAPNGASAVEGEIEKLTAMTKAKKKSVGRPLRPAEIMGNLPDGCAVDPDHSKFA